MNEEIFRKKSLEKIKSPESLNDYIRVANPGVWLILAGAAVLLIGACIWGIFGHVDRTVKTDVYVENGEAVCYIDVNAADSVEVGTPIKIGTYEGFIVQVKKDGEDRYECDLQTETMPEDGIYTGELVVERIKPISFVLN